MTMIRTAMGKLIDMNAITKQNENTIAVGNVPMNAKGDRISPDGKIVVSASDIARVQRDISDVTTTVGISEVNNPEQIIEKQKNTKKKKHEPKIVNERTRYGINGEEIIEVEYEDGSIEVKDAK